MNVSSSVLCVASLFPYSKLLQEEMDKWTNDARLRLPLPPLTSAAACLRVVPISSISVRATQTQFCFALTLMIRLASLSKNQPGPLSSHSLIYCTRALRCMFFLIFIIYNRSSEAFN